MKLLIPFLKMAILLEFIQVVLHRFILLVKQAITSVRGSSSWEAEIQTWPTRMETVLFILLSVTAMLELLEFF